jgi:hypothetical protein
MRRLIMGLKDKKFGNGELKPQWLVSDEALGFEYIY